MARVWQEGFEHGMPNNAYLQGDLQDTQIDKWYNANSLGMKNTSVTTGRNIYSKYALLIDSNNPEWYYYFDSGLDEAYYRIYFNLDCAVAASNDIISIRASTDSTSYDEKFQLFTNADGTISFKVRISTVLTTVATVPFNQSQWYKLDVYLKTDSSTGAYEIRLDNVTIASDSGLNLRGYPIDNILFDFPNVGNTAYDDIAVNDTTGSVNNSWCGDGTIVGLKPNGSGSSTQWDNAEGFAYAESGTNTTTLKITGHGLSTNDIIYNKTRDTYRVVTVSDADTLTMSSITGQTENDIIIMYDYDAQYTAQSGTNTDYVVLPSSHTYDSADVLMNVTRSNAIRKIIYVSIDSLYNEEIGFGSTISSQTSGDTINVYKVHFYSMNHYECVSNDRPNKQESRIRSTTSNDIDLFDMEELNADKSIPTGASIKCVSLDITCQDNGVGGSELIPVVRSGSTNSEQTSIPLTTQYLTRQTIIEQSPFTSSAWTRSEIDGIEAGVKVS